MSRGRTYTGVFGVSMATLVLEILLTRITSVMAWYHLAFFVISLAMLGMTAGAVVVFLRPRWFAPELVHRRMAQGSALLGLVTPIAVWFALRIPLEPITDAGGFVSMLAYGTALAIPFTVSGTVLTLALTRASLPPGLVYGVDLCGAAAGCLFVIPLLDWVDAPSAVLVASALAAAAGLAFGAGAPSSQRLPARSRQATAALVVALLGLTFANLRTDGAVLRPRYVKGAEEIYDFYEYVGWNTYSRVTVSETVELPPVFWAAGRNASEEIQRPIPQRDIRIDGAAATPFAALDTTPDDGRPGSPEEHAYLAWDVTSFAHRLRPHGPAAVIGVGGGRDVVEAARVGHQPVVGIELNDLIVDLHTDRMREFSGLVGIAGVELVNAEARSYMAADDRRYAVITMSLIDTWASTGAGAYALSENGLYTIEGWLTFMRRLQADGIFTVSRWYKPDSPGETARMLALAMETLWRIGAHRPRDHIILLQSGNIATLLLSPRPFRPSDVDLMQKEAVAAGFNMLVTPRRLPINPLLLELARIEDRRQMWQWADAQMLDLTPPSDERPFFFNMLRPQTWLGSPDPVDKLDWAFLGNLHATQTLIYATAVSALLTMMALVLPLWGRRRELADYAPRDLTAAAGYFALIGLGFMFVEMGLLSRLNVFLGHPTLALAVLLGGIIFFAGIGSMLSGRVAVAQRKVALAYPMVPAALVVGAAAALDPLMGSLAAASTPVRVVIGIAIVGIPALGLGLGFPLGLRLVSALADGDGFEARPDLGPWMWGINGACGVVATGLALTCSMVWGISTTLGVGAVCYALLPLCTARLWATAHGRPDEAPPSEVETEAVSLSAPSDTSEGPDT